MGEQSLPLGSFPSLPSPVVATGPPVVAEGSSVVAMLKDGEIPPLQSSVAAGPTPVLAAETNGEIRAPPSVVGSSWRDKFYNLPMEYWTIDGLSHLASGIGKPLCLDAQTAAMDRIGYAKICIEVPKDIVLPDSVSITRLSENGELICDSIVVSYPWKPKVGVRQWVATRRRFKSGWSEDLAICTDEGLTPPKGGLCPETNNVELRVGGPDEPTGRPTGVDALELLSSPINNGSGTSRVQVVSEGSGGCVEGRADVGETSSPLPSAEHPMAANDNDGRGSGWRGAFRKRPRILL
ncbi:hypothetical protein K2173_003161 [Erythroxylum novogranatense]|uniref:DUF4283 domain-containing protein n=1 Tax=Erythroxylum novogranatense TaxID=1862640 RepID=A0AAV8TBL3_9ROSI|nr:hypothetical protein K2173_003161 [Erythroxylum novogranatense]